MAMTQTRVGVVGAGLHGEMHLAAYSTDDRCELTCICDLNEERARQMAQKYRCDWTTNIAELASVVDGATVATPDFAHLAPALQLIAAGKHVLMEKPLTTDVAEGERLVAAAREHGVKLMVNFSNRWNPKFLAARDAMSSAQLGNFVMGYSRLSNTISVPTNMLAWASQSGPEWFLFPHTIDVVRWIVGREITQVYAAGHKGVLTDLGINAYDAIQAVVHFGDAFVTFETCWVIPNSWPSVVDSTMTLFGTAGRIEIDQNDQGITFAGDRFETGAPYGRYDQYGVARGFYLEGIRHFVDCLVNDRDPVVTGEDGLAVTRAITAIRESIVSGGPVIVAAESH
jgi:predicted dehydrogenase